MNAERGSPDGPHRSTGRDDGVVATASSRRLELLDVSKSYPGVDALSAVCLTVEAGEVHGLVGENGAGKSTLVGVASGAVQPEAGTIRICGEAVKPGITERARDLGLAIVHQRPALPPDLTVAENFLLAVPDGRRRDGNVDAWVAGWLEPWGALARFRPSTMIDQLSPAERFVVEIARALAAAPRVLILDEPTAHLDRDGGEVLFEAVARLRSDGCSIVYISHRLREVQRLADRISVLRDGRGRGTFRAEDVSEEQLVELIAGRALSTIFPDRNGARAAAGAPALEVRDFRTAGVSPVDLAVQPGEVVGFAGIEDNGQRELMRALAGLAPSTGGVEVNGRRVRLGSPHAAVRSGIAYVPADRHREGLLHGLGVRENAALVSVSARSRMGVVRAGAEAARVSGQMSDLSVKASSLATPIETLSGGNQQKVMLARQLLGEPAVLLADEPTQGVDVGARVEIYRILRGVADEGRAVIVTSAEAIELEGLCDRVLVFCRGNVVAELAGADLTEQRIMRAAVTSTRHRATTTDQPPGPLRRLLRSQLGPAAVLLLVVLLLGAYTASQNEFFLGGRNLEGMLALVAALVFVGLGQQLVMLTAGIDLSVGALSGFLVVIASFWVIEGATTGELVIGLLAVLGGALAVGLLNWSLIEHGEMHPIVATLVTFMGLQGLSLVLRPTPDGTISQGVADVVLTQVGPIPVAFLVAAVLAVAMELVLRRTQLGIAVRAIGSDARASEQLGISGAKVRLAAYVGSSLLVVLAATMLMTQVGIGDANAGTPYTLSSIAAVVLGGASIFGGRGSFIGVLAGAFLIEEILNATTFLGLSSAWQYYLVGGLTACSAALYSHVGGGARRSRTAG